MYQSSPTVPRPSNIRIAFAKEIIYDLLVKYTKDIYFYGIVNRELNFYPRKYRARIEKLISMRPQVVEGEPFVLLSK